ncbi:MAG TPA: hypothetical protein VLM37_10625, partial [Fibrobacteraceae bacterium]|nr:hypothetical protein [Fibrobacteraceae bacterium]
AIQDCTGIASGEFQFVKDGGENCDHQLLQEKRNFLKFINDYFHFFPGEDPEDTMILASRMPNKPQWRSKSENGFDSKEAIKRTVEGESFAPPDAADFKSFRNRLLKDIDMGHPHIIQIVKDLTDMLEKCNVHPSQT